MAEEGSGMIDNDPCWYCHCPPGDDLVFSWEFDTYVHLSCVRARLSEYWTDRELRFIADEVLPADEIKRVCGADPTPPEDRAAIMALPDVDAIF